MNTAIQASGGGSLNMATGEFRSCYASPYTINLYKDIERPIKFFSVGHHCRSPFCMNSSHFIVSESFLNTKLPLTMN